MERAAGRERERVRERERKREIYFVASIRTDKESVDYGATCSLEKIRVLLVLARPVLLVRVRLAFAAYLVVTVAAAIEA